MEHFLIGKERHYIQVNRKEVDVTETQRLYEV